MDRACNTTITKSRTVVAGVARYVCGGAAKMRHKRSFAAKTLVDRLRRRERPGTVWTLVGINGARRWHPRHVGKPEAVEVGWTYIALPRYCTADASRCTWTILLEFVVSVRNAQNIWVIATRAYAVWLTRPIHSVVHPDKSGPTRAVHTASNRIARNGGALQLQ